MRKILYLEPDENDAPLREVARADIVIKGATIIKDRFGDAQDILLNIRHAKTVREWVGI